MSVWEDIKDRLSVEEVIADYIPLVNAGSNYKAVCPFHQEKSPSLMISPSKGIWHCFGCGEGGDIFAFVSQIENLDKQETLKRLAKKAGVDLASYDFRKTAPANSNDSEDGNQATASTSDHEYGLKVLDWTAIIYHKILLKILEDYKHPVTIYCRQRQLTQEIINTFKIGYAPRADTVKKLAAKHNLNENVLMSAGILKQNEKGISDKFKDRLIIPIESTENSIVGFTARVLPGDKYERPKYLNSSQSEWFNKSDLWFGLNHAKPFIIRQKNAIIVEGNMDVVSCHQVGLTTAIASQGTSFTDNQLKILKRMTRRVSLAFDNDEAGILAGKKFFIQATQLGITVDRVVVPSAYKDIDEYISQTASANEPLNIEVVPYFQWYLTVVNSQLVSQDMHVQRKAIEDCIDVIEAMDPLSQEQSMKLVAEVTTLSLSTLQSLLKPKKSSQSKAKIAQDTLEDELTQAKQIQKPLVNSWKNFLATNFHDKKNEHLLSQMYFLLRDVFPVVGTYETLDEYIAEHKDELEYISQELQTSEDDRTRQIKTQLILELDREIYVMLLKPEILQNYITIKQMLN